MLVVHKNTSQGLFKEAPQSLFSVTIFTQYCTLIWLDLIFIIIKNKQLPINLKYVCNIFIESFKNSSLQYDVVCGLFQMN